MGFPAPPIVSQKKSGRAEGSHIVTEDGDERAGLHTSHLDVVVSVAESPANCNQGSDSIDPNVSRVFSS